MKKNTLIALLIASSLTLAGCAGVSEETQNGSSSENGTVDRTPTETTEPVASKADEYGALTQEAFLALAPTDLSEVLRAELKAILAASVSAGSEAIYEELRFSGDTFTTVLYSNPSKNESLLSFVMDENGVVVEDTTFLYSNMFLSISDLSSSFEDGVVSGISKDATGGYLVSIKYPQEDGTDISLIYYVTVKDGLVETLVTTANYSPDMVVLVLGLNYGPNAEYEKNYETAKVSNPGS
jgi:hypothetical protein